MRRRDELSLSPHDRAETTERMAARAGSGRTHAAARCPPAAFRDDRPRRRHAPEPPSAHVSRTRRRPSAFACKVEFALRITNIHAECPHTGDAERKRDAAQALTPGTRYLRARTEHWRERIASEDAAGRIERALRQHLDPAAENAVWGFATTRSATLIASYLVERNEVSAFVRSEERRVAKD